MKAIYLLLISAVSMANATLPNVGKVARTIYSTGGNTTYYGSGFLIDDTSFDRKGFYTCGPEVRVVTANHVLKHATLGSSFSLSFGTRFYDFEEITWTRLDARVAVRDIEADLAVSEKIDISTSAKKFICTGLLTSKFDTKAQYKMNGYPMLQLSLTNIDSSVYSIKKSERFIPAYQDYIEFDSYAVGGMSGGLVTTDSNTEAVGLMLKKLVDTDPVKKPLTIVVPMKSVAKELRILVNSERRRLHYEYNSNRETLIYKNLSFKELTHKKKRQFTITTDQVNSKPIGSEGHDIGKAIDVKSEGHDVGSEGHDVGSEGHDVGSEGHDVGSEGHDVGSEGHDVTGKIGDIKSEGHDVNGRRNDPSKHQGFNVEEITAGVELTRIDHEIYHQDLKQYIEQGYLLIVKKINNYKIQTIADLITFFKVNQEVDLKLYVEVYTRNGNMVDVVFGQRVQDEVYEMKKIITDLKNKIGEDHKHAKRVLEVSDLTEEMIFHILSEEEDAINKLNKVISRIEKLTKSRKLKFGYSEKEERNLIKEYKRNMYTIKKIYKLHGR